MLSFFMPSYSNFAVYFRKVTKNERNVKEKLAFLFISERRQTLKKKYRLKNYIDPEAILNQSQRR